MISKDMDYRVIIAGCRDFDNYELLKERCELFLRDKTETHCIW